MYGELGRGSWSGGFTKLSVVNGSDVDKADGYSRTEVAYEFRSQYDDEDTRDPPAVQFTPAELRDVVQEVKDELPTDPFDAPDFSPLREWLNEHGDRVIAEVGVNSGLRKQFRMKWSDDDETPYVKVQRRDVNEETGEDTYLRASPTIGPAEFEGIFSDVSVP